ncbi:MAG TPA: PEGA domain-containing protein [Methanoregulaceae archaeon]|nr:PEGA domain-containing protein [Methanoregulaceae archaeon]
MKTWLRIIGYIGILALFCSPGLAVSTSGLLSSYQVQYAPGQDNLEPYSYQLPITVPTPLPVGITRTGTLSVSSTPAGAMVSLDGVERGMTPITITGVSGGFHQLRVTLQGYEDYSTRVAIWPGKTVTVPVTLKAPSAPTPVPTPLPTGITRTGTLSVTSTPAEAMVFLDGVERGITPLTISGVSAGLHQLRVTRQGYEEYSTTVRIWPGKTLLVPVTLKIRMINNDTIRKPNIYLYSDRDLTARVQLAPEHAITVSEPVYQPGKGWQAEIRSGSLNGAGDFLFYEALVPSPGWQKEEGYIIRAAYREEDMASMLGEYGFNEKETREFIDYWAGCLTGEADYVFYPQETGAVDRVMQLHISPEPDEVSRIWFSIEPLVRAPEPVQSPETIIRSGFYVVEWGGMIQDE